MVDILFKMADEEENLVLVVNCSKYLSSEELIKRKLKKAFRCMFISANSG